jgi:hypothetical protein
MRYYTTNQISEKISETPEGFLLCEEVPITRTGYLEYSSNETPIKATDGSAIILVSREEEEVFSDETIASFEGKPVTIGHPSEFVSPENWKELTVGITQNVRRGQGLSSDKLIADLLITDISAIPLVKSGELREVSCGYEADYVQVGDARGQQTNIRGNHIALVTKGRAGSTCAIHDNHKEVSMYKKITEKLKSTIAKTIDEAIVAVTGEEEKEEAMDAASKIADMASRLEALDARLAKLEGVNDVCKEEDKKPTSDEAPDAPVVDEDGIETLVANIEASVAQVKEMIGGTKKDEPAAEVVTEAQPAIDADTLSRAEILAPGIACDKDIKRNALKAAYATTDGRSVIDTLNAGHAVTTDGDSDLSTIFIAASELLKTKRSNSLVGSKSFDLDSTRITHKTPDINEINHEFWNRK